MTRTLAILLLSLVGLTPGGPAQARYDPNLGWHTLTTPRFFLHFHDGEEDMAREFLVLAEEAHAELTRRLGFTVAGQIHLVLANDQDTANGFAMVIPYDTILLYGHPPDTFGDLGFHSDWKRILIYHELAHIFHLSRATGLPGLGNRIFGRTFLPNATLPSWFNEGLTVLTESTIASGGRVYSPKFDMYLRTQIAEDSLFAIDEITGDPLRMPRGATAYLYGGYFFHWLTEEYGQEPLANYIEEQGRKIVPFSINISARRHFGKTFVELYEDWKQFITDRFQRQIREIRDMGVVQGTRLLYAGESLPMPSFTPEGDVLWYRNDGRSPAQLRRRTASGDDVRLLWCRGGCSRATQTRQGDIVFASLEYHDSFYFHQDLFVLEKQTGHTNRLTQGERASHPAPSPDGSQVAYITTRGDRTTLRILNRSSGASRDVLEIQGILAWPVWSPTGDHIACSIQQHGRSNIISVQLATGQWRQLSQGASIDFHPAWSPDGRWVVFVSTRDGVPNLYAVEVPTLCVARLTRVVGGALSPTLSPDGSRLIYAAWHADGYHLEAQTFQPEDCQSDHGGKPPGHRTSRPPPESGPELQAFRETPSSRYRPVRHIYPRSWSPSFLTSSLDTSLIGLETSGSDPVGKISYTARLDVNTKSFDTAASVSSSLDFLYPLVTLFGGYYRNTALARINDDFLDYHERNVYVSSHLSFPFHTSDRRLTLSAGYIFQRLSGEITEPWTYDPAGSKPYIPTKGNLASVVVSWVFDNTERFAWSVATDKGTRVELELGWSAPPLGSQWTRTRTKWRLSQYFPAPFVANHSLLAHLRGGYSTGRETFLQTFTVGGYPDQDIVSDLLYGGGVNGLYLRGYPPYAARGRQYHYASLDYRLPLWRIRRGIETYPIFLQDLHLNLFGNGAAAFNTLDFDEILWGTGAELKLSFLLAYATQHTLSLGVAHGFREPGGFGVYVLLGN